MERMRGVGGEERRNREEGEGEDGKRTRRSKKEVY